MKKKEYKDIKGKEIKDLKNLVEEKRTKLRKFLIDLKTGSEKNVKKGAILRDEIARILTLIREKEILEGIQVEKEVEKQKKEGKKNNK